MGPNGDVSSSCLVVSLKFGLTIWISTDPITKMFIAMHELDIVPIVDNNELREAEILLQMDR